MKKNDWPFLKSYTGDNLLRLAMPIGGIGTGTVSLGGRGDLRDWELMNRASKGFTPKQGDNWFANGPSVLLHTCDEDGNRDSRLLEGPIDPVNYEGQAGCDLNNHNYPRMDSVEYRTAYPLAELRFEKAGSPVAVSLQAFNPMIPGNTSDSSMPCASFVYWLKNESAGAVKASVCFSMPNYIGADRHVATKNCYAITHDYGPRDNVNEFRKDAGIQGVFMRSDGVPQDHSTWGTMAITTDVDLDVTYRTRWARLSWGDTMLDFWDDFSEDGRLEERTNKRPDPLASLCVSVDLQPGEETAVPFLLTWHFPNRPSWDSAEIEDQVKTTADKKSDKRIDIVGNHYCTQYEDAWDVAVREFPRMQELEEKTLSFLNAYLASDAPDAIKEAALFNLVALRSQTCFRTPDGHFFGWEGTHNYGGSCFGSCTHVWNYEQGLGYVFGELSRDMREIELLHNTRDCGAISTRVKLPLPKNDAEMFWLSAADGHLGVIMRTYRDWQLSGDDAFLDRVWPSLKRAMEFCWVEGGWDADKDGLMEGCQHNTMDVEYFGPNGQMNLWYLGALRAVERMATAKGDAALAQTCSEVYEKGRRATVDVLFNGDFLEHKVMPPGKGATIHPATIGNVNAVDLDDPQLQLGSACLVDQLVGQYMAHVCNLGHLIDEEVVRTTLATIKRENWRDSMTDHFCHFRSYALGNEQALLMASYPRGGRPKRPFPYCNEVMTGFEYSTAVHMLYEGMAAEGLACFQAIRNRYDGRKRNPYDEAECGHQYARALASWGGLLAWSGFNYSAVEKTISVDRPGAYFWSTGSAWGRYTLAPSAQQARLEVEVLYGSIEIGAIRWRDAVYHQDRPHRLEAGDKAEMTLPIATDCPQPAEGVLA
jgi:uncharacterized protein (DUF608 family)